MAPASLSFVQGPSEPPLLQLSLCELLEQQSTKYPHRDAIVSWTGVRLTYKQLYTRSQTVAKGLLAIGIRPGDRIGILSGNCERYIEIFFATTIIGGIVVVLNNTYTPTELLNALEHSGCRALFTSTNIGSKNILPHIELVTSTTEARKPVLPYLQDVVLIRSNEQPISDALTSYDEFVMQGNGQSTELLEERMRSVGSHDVCNLQYTSGTTGEPKAAMLTHHNIINNGRFIGARMKLTEVDRICCPPPLFHCFGLVLGLLACITHGSALVLPSQTFDPVAVLDIVIKENCTGLHGVPTMFLAELEQLRHRKHLGTIRLRTGIAAGSPVSQALMEQLQQMFGLPDLTITYGMTETSPASFMTSVDDGITEKLSTVGRILPHTTAKVINSKYEVVPRGVPGELWVSGYNVQVGYFNDPQKTNEVMVKDEDGVLWMKTGDEVTLDEKGFCRITGRIKDIIIRGGENIYPLEIEERLAEHPLVLQAAVVGLKDSKYGEIPAAFVAHDRDANGIRPSDVELQDWVRATLGRHKIPIHIFWLGDEGVCEAFPITGSGKLKKNELRDLGNNLITSM
ncbi:hypothetical protein F5884DRAFT_284170 [Xylogone sp. PMI_703]|nr:hypothetical protein F5884DRAFT_284170 [Xylogone sp. PMI_703]